MFCIQQTKSPFFYSGILFSTDFFQIFIYKKKQIFWSGFTKLDMKKFKHFFFKYMKNGISRATKLDEQNNS